MVLYDEDALGGSGAGGETRVEGSVLEIFDGGIAVPEPFVLIGGSMRFIYSATLSGPVTVSGQFSMSASLSETATLSGTTNIGIPAWPPMLALPALAGTYNIVTTFTIGADQFYRLSNS